MRRALRRLAAPVTGLVLVAALASPCPCPSDTTRQAEHACCTPPAGVRASEAGCCGEQPTLPDVVSASPAATGQALVATVDAMPAPGVSLELASRRPVVLAPAPPAAHLRL
jgi:hypothetical protein